MPLPSAPTGLTLLNSAVLQFFKAKISNKAALSIGFTSTDPAATHYLERSANGSSGWTRVSDVEPGPRTIVAAPLPLGSHLFLRMRAQNTTGFSTYSSSLEVDTPDFATAIAPPAAPTGLTATGMTSYSVVLNWTDHASNEAGFYLEFARGSLVKGIYVDGLTTTARVDLSVLFNGPDVARQFFTVRIKAIGGKASASQRPHFESDWTELTAFQLLAPAIRIISPLSRQAEQGATFNYIIATNTPAISWSAEPLPTGLILSGNVISGAPDTVGVFDINLSASDDFSEAPPMGLHLTVVPSLVKFYNPATATALLGKSFSLTLLAGPAGVSFSAVGLPVWLTLNSTGTQTTLQGTPDEPGVFEVQVSGSAGTSIATQTIAITVPPVSLVTPTELKGALGQDFRLTLTAVPSGCIFSAEDLPIADGETDSWLSLSPEGVLSGTPPAQGTYSFDITASLDDDGDSKTYTLTIGPLFEITKVTDDVVYGAVGRHLLEHVRFAGFGAVTTWWLSNAPEGLELWDLMPAEGDPYYGTFHADTQRRGIRGAPTQSGPFVATVSVNVLQGYEYETYSVDIPMRIAGGLYVPWFHLDPALYDLQVSIRGDAATRSVQSYYGIAARPANTTSETVGDITTTTQNVATEGNLLTLKRGDTSPCIGILIRNDIGFLGAGPGEVSEVRLTIRESDAEDGDYLFDISAEAVVAGPNTYFRAQFEVDGESLDDAMSDDSLTRLTAFGEISWTYAGALYTSPTFTITIAEDIHR